ncbi:MAG: TonB-dependent receptor, partial [Gallionella sp.]
MHPQHRAHQSKPSHLAQRTLIASLLAVWLGAAQAADPINIDIPSQPLASALAKFAEQSGVKATYPAELLAGKSAPRIEGKLSPQQALEKLLAGSGLRYEFVTSDAVKIEAIPVSPEKVMEMSPIEVRGAMPDREKVYAVPNATSGTKTDTPLIVTPVTVTVIPQQVLKDQQITKLEEAVTNSSGVWMYNSGQGCNGTCESVALRGFTSFSNNVLKDGLMVPTAGGLTNMSNVESVEVVKGPASILYGRMEPGGVVSVITKKPKSTAGYSLEQTVGTHSTYLTNLDATGPANNDKSLLYRINMSWDSHDGYWTKQNNDRKFVAPSLQWNISPQTQALLELTYTKDKYASLSEINPVDPVTNQTVQLSPSGNRSPSLQYTDTTYAKLGLTHNFNDEWSVKAQVLQSKSNQASDSNSFQVAGFTQVGATWTVDRALTLTHGYTDVQSTQLDATGHFDTGSLKHTLLLGADSSKTNSYTTTGNNLDALAFNYVMDTTDAFNPAAPAGGQT